MHFAPAAFVRHVPGKFLQDYFAKRRQLNEIAWEALSPTDSKLVHEAILQLPTAQVREIHGHFRAVWEMAAREYACWLIQVAREHGVDLTGPEQREKSAYERAFRMFLDHPAVFEEARALAHWENLPRRSTERRNGMGRPTAEGRVLLDFLRNGGKLTRRGDDMDVLRPGRRLGAWMGAEGSPFQYVPSRLLWSARFETR